MVLRGIWPKQQVFDLVLAVFTVKGLFYRGFRPVLAISRIRCSSISERYPDPDAWHRIRMFGRISPDVGRERFFEEWPETRSKQAFYREYSQNKVKYMGFGPVSSRNVRGTMRDADLDMRGADLDMRDSDLNMRI